MTFDEAMKAAKQGQYVRYRGMGPGWTIGVVPKVTGFFCFNPHTGSEYGYSASEGDKARTDWKIAKNKRDVKV